MKVTVKPKTRKEEQKVPLVSKANQRGRFSVN